MMMNKKAGILLISLILTSCSCRQDDDYCYNGLSGNKLLTLYSNNEYEFFWHRIFGVGPLDDTLHHRGNYHVCGDTFILNSYVKPNNYDLFEVKESVKIESDSITIVVKTNDSTPFFFITPVSIRVDDRRYDLKEKSIDSSFWRIVNRRIDYIILGATLEPHYPVYFVKDSKSNYFEFTITEILDEKDNFPYGSYFYNRKYVKLNDTLFLINNNKVSDIHLLWKCDFN